MKPTLRLRVLLIGGLSSAFLLFLLLALFRCDAPSHLPPSRRPHQRKPAIKRPVRTEPATFAPDTNLPEGREVRASGRIDPATFLPERDIIRIDDPRVWWESDHDDPQDTEDDHLVNVAMEGPLRHLIDLVCRLGGRLKVQDAYRPSGKHVAGSLHREGRAVDLTCDELGLEKLAKLCWVAGFDWVYHEASAKQGAHVHCSIKRRTEIADQSGTSTP